ncbi:MAG: inositol monophosphatase [Deltaproteobacteria bacterium]|nr:inositol monophosphatase [Deltaproteobacteria bacterium]
MSECNDLKNAEMIARHAGKILMAGYESVTSSLNIEYKGAINLVTDFDRKSEQYIVSKLQELYPNDSILAEESGLHGDRTGRVWCIDPLDGTTNFAHGLPFFTVSIALLIDSVPHSGVVYNPVFDWMFSVEKGVRGTLNGSVLGKLENGTLERALVLYGCGYDRRLNPERYIRMMETYMVASQGIRRTGSASLDCCLVAWGKADAYVEVNLFPWDLAAGALLAEAAGAIVTDVNGEKFDAFSGRIMVGRPGVHSDILEISKKEKLFIEELSGKWDTGRNFDRM